MHPSFKSKSMKIIIALIATVCCGVVTAQYNVVAFEGQYEELQDFNSIALETLGDLYWEKEFDLPFTFPYFDTSFEYIKCDVEGTCRFENDIDFSLRLMTFGYLFDNVLDPNNIESDVRYTYGQEDNKGFLVVQFTKNRLFSDTSIDEFDSHVNFQYWFFEDGTIEIRFGPSNLDNSPVYVPGEGFYLWTDQGPIPAGPQLALYHPFDEDIRVEYNDLASHEEYELNTDGTGSIDWWPPDGWVIRFTNQLVSTDDIKSTNSISVYPNPTPGTLLIDSEEQVKETYLLTPDGRTVVNGHNLELEISHLPCGIYYLNVYTNLSTSTHKIIKL